MKRIIRRTLALAIALMLAMPFTVGLADERLPCVDAEADVRTVEAAGADLDGVDADISVVDAADAGDDPDAGEIAADAVDPEPGEAEYALGDDTDADAPAPGDDPDADAPAQGEDANVAQGLTDGADAPAEDAAIPGAADADAGESPAAEPSAGDADGLSAETPPEPSDLSEATPDATGDAQPDGEAPEGADAGEECPDADTPDAEPSDAEEPGEEEPGEEKSGAEKSEVEESDAEKSGEESDGEKSDEEESDEEKSDAAGKPSGDAAEDAPADIDAAEDGLSLEDAITIEAEMPDASEESAAEEAANALFEGQESIIYLDAAGEMKSATCTDIRSLTETDNLTGWYYIPDGRVVTIERRIAVSGDAHLILCDGAWLTIQGGINVSGTIV